MDDFWDNADDIDSNFYTGEEPSSHPIEIPVNPFAEVDPASSQPDIQTGDLNGFEKAGGSDYYLSNMEGPEVSIPDLKTVIEENSGNEISLTSDTESNKTGDINILGGSTETLEMTNHFEYSSEESSPGNIPESEALSQIYGSPESDMDYWVQQLYPDTCAIVSQKFIIEDFVGVDLTEDQLRDMAIDKGYYTPGHGTFPYEVGNIIEDFGITVLRNEGNTFDDIVEKLTNNQKIIVSVDSNAIWNGSDSWSLIDLLHMPGADHAVQVIGYNSENETVILNDPGHPDGQGMTVPLNDFLYGWDAGNNFMVSTIDPAPPSYA